MNQVARLLLVTTVLLGFAAGHARGETVVTPMLAVTVQDGLLTLDARDVPLAEVLDAIGEESGVRVLVGDDVTAQVTASFADVPLADAVSRLCRWHSLVVVFDQPENASGRPRLIEVHVYGASPGPDGGPGPVATPRRPEGPGSAPTLAQEGGAPPDPLFGARIGAARALGQPHNDAGIPALAQTLTTDPNPNVRMHAAIALSSVGTPTALSALMDGVADESASVRIRVVDALGRFHDERALATLEQISRGDSELSVRARAALALGFLKDTRGLSQGATRR